VVDAAPGDVGDVQQAVDAAEVHEGAVVGDVLDHAVEDHAFLEALDSSARCSARVSSSTARRETTMLPRARSILRIWKGCGAAHQRADVAHRADVDLAARQEGHRAAEVDGEAALHAAEDHAVDALLALKDFSRLVQASSRRAFSRDSTMEPSRSS
jgi:hypothetical protein